MSSRSAIKLIFKDPILGVVPFILFSVMVVRMDPHFALLLVMSLSFMGRFLVKSGHRLFYNLTFLTSVIVFVILQVTPVELSPIKCFTLFEMFFVALITVCSLLQKRAYLYSRCNKQEEISTTFSICTSNSYMVAFRLQYFLLLHLFVLVTYVEFFDVTHDEGNDFLGRIVVLLFLLSIFATAIIRSLYITYRLKGEEWLPVVGECGKVKGRIAKSESEANGHKYMHPILRIAIIHNGMIYLRKGETPNNDADSLSLDHPCETLLKYKMSIDEALCSTMSSQPNREKLPVKFVLKYMYENEKVKRLVYLFVSVIKEEKVFDAAKFEGGKLWTITQIKDNLNKSVFSEMFELEFDYLKNTILLAENTIKKNIA